MFRRSAVQHNGFKRLQSYFSYRDPAERNYNSSRLLVDIAKRSFAFSLVGVVMIGAISYEQYKDPSKVKLPKQDARSLVI